MNVFDLTDRVAVVSGGTGWLGQHITEALCELGATVYVASRNPNQEVVSRLRSQTGARIESVMLDIEDAASIASCFEHIVSGAGGIDILVNNAYSGTPAFLEDTTLEGWDKILRTGVTGYFRCIQEAVPRMPASGSATIINISSMYGMVAPDFRIYEGTPYASSPAYGAAKAGVIQLTRYCASALASKQIRVNCISLGAFPSEAPQQNQQFVRRLEQKIPMGRIGQPHEIKGTIAYLASSASSYVTGQNIVVDGGWTTW